MTDVASCQQCSFMLAFRDNWFTSPKRLLRPPPPQLFAIFATRLARVMRKTTTEHKLKSKIVVSVHDVARGESLQRNLSGPWVSHKALFSILYFFERWMHRLRPTPCERQPSQRGRHSRPWSRLAKSSSFRFARPDVLQDHTRPRESQRVFKLSLQAAIPAFNTLWYG